MIIYDHYMYGYIFVFRVWKMDLARYLSASNLMKNVELAFPINQSFQSGQLICSCVTIMVSEYTFGTFLPAALCVCALFTLT